MEQLSTSVRARRIAAGVLLILYAILPRIPGLFHLGDDFEVLIRYVVYATGAVSLILLATVASNRQTLWMTLVLFFCIIWPISGRYISYTIVSGTMTHLLQDFLYIYAISVIIRGNAIRNKDKAWIAILCIYFIFPILNRFGMACYCYYTPFSDNLAQLYSNLWFSNLIFTILIAIAYYKLATCPAFSGMPETWPESPRSVYSPFNKYMAGMLITSVVVTGLMYVCSAFIVPLL